MCMDEPNHAVYHELVTLPVVRNDLEVHWVLCLGTRGEGRLHIRGG